MRDPLERLSDVDVPPVAAQSRRRVSRLGAVTAPPAITHAVRARRRLALLSLAPLLAALLLLGARPPHPDSLSSSVVRVIGSEVHLTMRCQVLSLMEVVPGLDADGDGEVSEAEALLSRDAILTYIAEHYLMFVGTDRDLEGGRPLVPEALGVRPLPAGTEDARGYRKGAVDVEFVFRAGEPIRDLMIESTLFEDTSPGHIDLCTLQWDGGSSASFTLDDNSPRHRSDPEGRGAFAAFAALGFHHIMGGWDHLAFVIVLVLGARNLRSVLGVVTAFTAAHSITLVLSALGVVDLSAYSGFVEALIALSIAYVAADVLLAGEKTRARWGEAFGFGLVHGLGFASFLRESLVTETARGMALFAFNVGVELGQIPVALVCAGLLGVLRRAGPDASATGADAAAAPGLAPRWARRWGAAAIAVFGLSIFVTRL